jgi:CheY-like chemotaxis protein
MVDSLSDAGFVVLEAENGDQAVKILAQHPRIDLLVTDIDMPGPCDGNDVAINAKACTLVCRSFTPVAVRKGSPTPWGRPMRSCKNRSGTPR